jgi:hypothetical protein
MLQRVRRGFHFVKSEVKMPAIRRTNVASTAHRWGNANLKFDLYFRECADAGHYPARFVSSPRMRGELKSMLPQAAFFFW